MSKFNRIVTGNSVYLETGKLCVVCSTPLDEASLCPNCLPPEEREILEEEGYEDFECEEEFLEPDWLSGPDRELEE